MHALSHSLPYRGSGASRYRTRFQPYSSTLASSSTPSTRSPQSYLHTPASICSVSTPSTSYHSPLSHIDRARKPVPTPVPSSSSQAGQFREAQKSKYVTRLVDQAVNSLCEIWKPEDIPQVFRTTSMTACSAPTPVPTSLLEAASTTVVGTLLPVSRNIQLPSPISPTTRPSPVAASPFTSTVLISAEAARNSHLVPIRGFVHEVLRRSRTSTGVLQTALCYLEAVRRKVPDLLRKELAKASSGYVEEEEASSRIIVATEAEMAASALDTEELTIQFGVCPNLDTDFMDIEAKTQSFDPSMMGPPTAPLTELLPSMDTERNVPPVKATSSKKPSDLLPPLPPLPSPLLCPRRTFLACLILASKFMQDRSYSNRAWAKLAGLPPREIGRCERAVGEALEWRLWVGKGPAPTSVPAPGVGAHRAVTRCRTEASLEISPTCGWSVSTSPASMFVQQPSMCKMSQPVPLSGLRRASTMPNIGMEGSSRAGAQNPSNIPVFSLSYARPAECDALDALMPRFSHSLLSPANSVSWLGTGIQTLSPSLSTPTLTYSPASTTSSEDGERTVQIGSIDNLPVSSGRSAGSAMRFTDGLYKLPYLQDEQCSGLKLPSIEPMVVNAPVQLPPLSEALFNPVLVERTVGSLPGLDSIMGISGSDSYHAYQGWSVPGRS